MHHAASIQKKITIDQAPTLDFEVEDRFLLRHLLFSRSRSFADPQIITPIIAISRCAWRLDTEAYKFFIATKHDSFAEEEQQSLQIATDKLVQALIKTPEYKVLKEETQTLCDQVRLEWQENLEQTAKIVLPLLGMNLAADLFKVLVTHPGIYQGHYLGSNRIAWGGPTPEPNYSTIYLWHEILHAEHILGVGSDIKHAIIELVTDNELWKQLNGTAYPPFRGHYCLNAIKEALSDDWQNYLKNPSMGILAFSEAMQKKFESLEHIHF